MIDNLISIIKYTPPVFCVYNFFNTAVTLSAFQGNAQPWRFFIAQDIASTIDECVTSTYSNTTTHPLQGYSINFCLGRKDRLLGGFFNYAALAGTNKSRGLFFHIDETLNSGHNTYINLPLSCHSVGSRLGRKNRLMGGFFISAPLFWRGLKT